MVDYIHEDVLALLTFYIKHEMENERHFKVDQTNSKLKVCLYVHHNDHFKKEGGDVLIVHTKLKQSQMKSEIDNKRDNDFFYIKSQKVSHRTPNTSGNTTEHCHKTSIDTIVTKTQSNCETVFKTFIENTHDGKKSQIQKAFTREKIKCQHSVEGKNTLHRHGSSISNKNEIIKPDQVISNEDANVQNESKKLNRKSSKNAKKESTIKRSDSKGTTKPLISKNEPSPPKERKTILRKLKKAFSKKMKTRVPSILSIYVEPTIVNRKKSFAISRQFFTEDFEMESEKPTNIVAKMCMDSYETKNFEIIKDDIEFIDEADDDEITCIVLDDENMEDENYFQFDLEELDQPEMSTTNSSCDCESRRYETIYQYLMSKKSGKTFNYQVLSNFDYNSFHFRDCQMSSNYLPPRTPRTNRKGSVSPLSSYHCMDNMLNKIKLNNQINCTMETINYFIECDSYDSYEKGIEDVLDSTESFENFILFFYLTRVIIKQTDDPTDPKNVVIHQIMKFSQEYLIKHYIPLIKKMGGIENYISQIPSDVE